jgi:hypothetical protein
MVELPKPPWYRRFGVVFLAANLVVAAVLVAAVVALWPPAAPRPGDPATTAGAAPPADQAAAQATDPDRMPPSSTTARLDPGVLWQRRGSDAEVGELFAAPGRWRISWSFDCRSFAEHGGATSSWSVVATSKPSGCSALGSGAAASCWWLVVAGVV